MKFPTRFVAICDICKKTDEDKLIDTRAEGIYQYTCGWVKTRSGGGGHGISQPQRSNRWAHEDCVLKDPSGQGGLKF